MDVRGKRVQVRRNSGHELPRQVREAERRERKPAWPDPSGQGGDAERGGRSGGQGSMLGLQALVRGPRKAEAGLRFRRGPGLPVFEALCQLRCAGPHPGTTAAFCLPFSMAFPDIRGYEVTFCKCCVNA